MKRLRDDHQKTIVGLWWSWHTQTRPDSRLDMSFFKMSEASVILQTVTEELREAAS